MTERKLKIVTDYSPPPIPTKAYDWSAVLDDYEPGAPIGWGATQAAAIRDLIDQLEDEA